MSALVQPQHIFPFAGQHLLGGSLFNLNQFRGMYDLDHSAQKLKNSTGNSVITLQPLTYYALTDLKQNQRDYTEPTARSLALYSDKIRSIRFPYQKRELTSSQKNNLQQLLDSRLQNLVPKAGELYPRGTEQSLTIRSHLTLSSLSYRDSRWKVTPEPTKDSENITLSMDDRLLHRLLVRKPGYQGFTDLHLNVADGGNHLTWRREGRYNPVFTSLLWHL
jgi:hypothetical protein